MRISFIHLFILSFIQHVFVHDSQGLGSRDMEMRGTQMTDPDHQALSKAFMDVDQCPALESNFIGSRYNSATYWLWDSGQHS